MPGPAGVDVTTQPAAYPESGEPSPSTVEPSPPDDQALVGAVLAGDGDAFAHYRNRFSRLVAAIAWSFCQSSADAENLQALLWGHLDDQLEQYDQSRGSLGGFIAFAARHKAIDWHRSNSRQPTVSLDALLETGVTLAAGAENPEQAVLTQEKAMAVRECLDQLENVNYRSALEAWMLGYRAKETAEILQVSARKVDSWVERGKKAMAPCLEKKLGGLRAPRA